MDYQTELIHIAEQQTLTSSQFKQLQTLVTPQPTPASSQFWLKRGLLMVAALCLGLAVLFGIAANWSELSNFQRFAIVETTLAISLLAGCIPSRIRPAALLLATLLLGGLLALYAQIYSTNSDPWRLFAIWAAMALPIALAARHQAVWIAWVFIVLLATSLWQNQSYTPYYEQGTLQTIISWVILLTISFVLYPRGLLKTWLGNAQHLAFRWATCCSAIFITVTAISLLARSNTNWPLLLALAVLASIWYGMTIVRYADLSITALCALGIDTLIVTLLTKLFLESNRSGIGDFILITLLLGALTVTLLIFSIKLIKKTQGIYKPHPAPTAPSQRTPSAQQPHSGDAA